MVIRRRSGAVCLNAPLRIWLSGGICSLVMAGVVVTLSTRTVQADVDVPHSAASVPLSAPAVQNAAPEIGNPEPVAVHRKMGLLHGLASWYGEHFHGRKTASGERYDMNAMTACHASLPFGSLVKVVNLKNGRSVVVRITDRGDLADGRIIDLSYGAAQKLAMTRSGLAPVALDVLSRGPR